MCSSFQRCTLGATAAGEGGTGASFRGRAAGTAGSAAEGAGKAGGAAEGEARGRGQEPPGPATRRAGGASGPTARAGVRLLDERWIQARLFSPILTLDVNIGVLC